MILFCFSSLELFCLTGPFLSYSLWYIFLVRVSIVFYPCRVMNPISALLWCQLSQMAFDTLVYCCFLNVKVHSAKHWVHIVILFWVLLILYWVHIVILFLVLLILHWVHIVILFRVLLIFKINFYVVIIYVSFRVHLLCVIAHPMNNVEGSTLFCWTLYFGILPGQCT